MRRSACILGIVLPLLVAVAFCLGADKMSIERIVPTRAAPGEVVDIIGRQFGPSQGRKYVTISRVVNRKPYSYRVDAPFWSDTKIRVRIPAGVPSDDYLVVIYDGSPSRYSNNKRLEIERRENIPDLGGADKISKGGMLIEELVPAVVAPGSVLQIHGRDFGLIPGNKLVSINGHNTRYPMKILSWSDRLVRVRIPGDLDDGGYLVLIYYDDKSYLSSSNSKPIKLAAGTAGGSTSLPPRSGSEDKYESGSARPRTINKGPWPVDRTETRDGADRRPADRISRGGMLIEEIIPAVAMPGSTIEIHGRDFGQFSRKKLVAINGHNTSHIMKIRSWSDLLVRAEIPRNLEGGGYLVLIYYDNSYRSSSNSKTIKIVLAHE